MRWLGIGFVVSAVLLWVVPAPQVRPALAVGIAGVVMLGIAALLWSRRAGVVAEGRVGSPYRDEPARPIFTPRSDANVQFRSSPFGPASLWGCCHQGRNPRHSYCPVPTVGRRRSRPDARLGRSPEEKYAVLVRDA